jgi:hypothetical protein
MFFLSSKSSAAFNRAAPGEIDLDSTGGRAPYFTADPIDPAAFVALASSCSNRLEVPACWW